jgi:DNA replication protein DnaC
VATTGELLESLAQKLQALQLTRMAAICAQEADQAAAKKLPYTQYLLTLCEAEWACRRQRAIEGRIQAAKFPFLRTLEQYRFELQPKLDERQVRELFTLSFIEQKMGALVCGPSGTGKTHIIVALGLAAIQGGYRVKFVRANDMVQELFASLADSSFKRRLANYLRPELLLVDEFGHVLWGRERAALFFEVISKRYEKGALVMTSNRDLAEWERVFDDATLASATLDRVFHTCKVFLTSGESYRLRSRKAREA